METNNVLTAYFYDSILGKNVYGVVPKTDEVECMETISEMFKDLSEESKEYLLVHLEMLKGVE